VLIPDFFFNRVDDDARLSNMDSKINVAFFTRFLTPHACLGTRQESGPPNSVSNFKNILFKKFKNTTFKQKK
jgi:hypothetical protein